MVTTLYLVRHGKTEGGDTKRYYGSIDIPLSEEGKRQVEDASGLISRHISNPVSSKSLSYLKYVQSSGNEAVQSSWHARVSRLSAVYCSGLQRAIRSAEIIAGPHNLGLNVVPDLRERSFGIWEGMTFTEIKESYPAEFELWAGNPLRYSPPGGESTLAVRDRVVTALEKLLDNHAGDNVAVVAHGGVNRVILCHLLGIPLENIFRIEQDYAAVNIIEFWERYPVVKLVNGRNDY